MTCYLKRLGESAAVKTWDEFAEATHIEEVTGKGNILGYLHELPDFVEAIKSPGTPSNATICGTEASVSRHSERSI